MPEYLTKEEIKKWRSSLEKITLEEYAKRLGKEIEGEKQTNDLVDIVLKGQPVMSSSMSVSGSMERISAVSQKALEREREISSSINYAPKSELVKKTETIADKIQEVVKKEIEKEVKAEVKSETTKESAKAKTEAVAKDNTEVKSEYEFKKPLTDREQMVFNYFLENKDQVVFAKDLAKLLNLPRDYVYKYIKTLRAKIEGDNLKNAESGGFILSDK